MHHGEDAFTLSATTALSAKGKPRFMTVSGKVKATVFVEFLKRLLHKSERFIFLIVDGHSAHRAATVTKFVESTKGRLRLLRFPAYSPEVNRDEWVWKQIKHDRVGRVVLTSAA